MLGKDLKDALATITDSRMKDGSLSSLWAKLPDYVAGSSWVDEVTDMAVACDEWLSDDDEVSEDYLSEISCHLADREIEDYYSTINKRVQDLSLWARPELDSEVSELWQGEVNPSLTDLNSHYLYCAMSNLASAVLSYAADLVALYEGAAR